MQAVRRLDHWLSAALRRCPSVPCHVSCFACVFFASFCVFFCVCICCFACVCVHFFFFFCCVVLARVLSCACWDGRRGALTQQARAQVLGEVELVRKEVAAAQVRALLPYHPTILP